MPLRLYNFFAAIVNILLTITGFFVGLRIILRLFSANPATPFVSWIYSISDFFVTPFRGIFPTFNLQTGVLDLVAVIALVGYMLLGYLVLELFKNLAISSTEENIHSTAHYHDIDEDLGEEEHYSRPRSHRH